MCFWVTHFADTAKERPANYDSHPTDSTMYTNIANLQQTMLLQQRLFRQALIRQKSSPGSGGSQHKNFTAPSLSQYQFVGSQQVSNLIIYSFDV